MPNPASHAGAGPDGQRPVERVRGAYVGWLEERLSERDWLVIETVNRLRLTHGDQLERLFFFSLSGRSKEVTRGRVLRRLVTWRVLDVLPRRIGGTRAGSSGSVFALGSAGQRLLRARQAATGVTPRVRHAGVPTERTLLHTLAVSELYVRLTELARGCGAEVVGFQAEPACWWPNGLDGHLKPDAYLLLDSGTVRDHWWVEVDRATESLPTIRRKLLTYLDFVQRGQLGPENIVPRVLITVPNPARRDRVRVMLDRLPNPAQELFHIATENDAAPLLFQVLRE
jgi:hypothetical protein